MNWLILGANGQLGRCLQIVLESENIPYRAVPHSIVDIRKIDSIRQQVNEQQPTVIVNAAAWTDVDGAESHVVDANSINGYGAENIALVASEFNISMIQISTDYVFDGLKRDPYSVEDFVNPLSVYGKSKLLGEQLSLRAHPNGTWVVRTAWLYSPFGRNFARTIIRKFLNREKLSVVNDVFGQPTSAMALAHQLVRLHDANPPPGVFHATNSGRASWFDFASVIVESLGGNDEISPVLSNSFPSIAPRPAFSVLDHSEWIRAGIQPMPHWKESLHEVLPQLIESLKTELT